MAVLNAGRSPAAALRTRAGFAAVMATGITSVASAELDLSILSWLFAALGFALYAALLLGLVLHPRAAPTGVEAFAAVAATAVLGTRLGLDGDGLAARAFLAAAAAVWIVVWVALARTRRLDPLGPATGTRLLAVVSTQSLAILVAVNAGLPSALGIALLSLGIALYAALIGGIPRSELRAGAGDVWITMGALAISALAAAHVAIVAGGRPLRDLAFALWVVATCWLPLLVYRELRHPRLRFEPKRWSTVFPLGMYSAASTAVGKTFGFADDPLGYAFLALAIAAWLLTAAGAFAPVVASLRRVEET